MTELKVGDRFYHRGFRKFGIYRGCDELSDPTMRTAHVQFDDGREAMAFRSLMERVCCDFHNIHCEPPSELCCRDCAEVGHPEHPRGVPCVLDRDEEKR